MHDFKGQLGKKSNGGGSLGSLWAGMWGSTVLPMLHAKSQYPGYIKLQRRQKDNVIDRLVNRFGELYKSAAERSLYPLFFFHKFTEGNKKKEKKMGKLTDFNTWKTVIVGISDLNSVFFKKRISDIYETIRRRSDY